MEDQGQHGMAAQQDAARHYQPVLEVNRDSYDSEWQLFITLRVILCFFADLFFVSRASKLGTKSSAMPLPTSTQRLTLFTLKRQSYVDPKHASWLLLLLLLPLLFLS